jgi:DNA replication protein DnaC
MKLSDRQMILMKDRWGFSHLHLMYEWEDLKAVPDWVKIHCKSYVDNFTLNPNKIFEIIQEGKAYGLFIYSKQNGTGKTSIIHQIAKDILESPIAVRKMRYSTALQIFHELKKCFNDRGGLNESEILDDIMTCDVLFIDDLDKMGKLSEYEKKRISLIIDKRYTDMRPIIITANKSIQEMASDEQLEPHIYSRLSQMCEQVKLDSNGDFRLSTIRMKQSEKRNLI